MIKLSSMIYTAIIMSLLMIAMLSFVGNMATSYNRTADTSSINRTIELGEKISSAYQTFQTDQPTTSVLGFTEFFIMGGNIIWNFIVIFLSLPELLASMAVDFIAAMGVPSEYTGGIFMLIIAGGILASIYILSKVEL